MSRTTVKDTFASDINGLMSQVADLQRTILRIPTAGVIDIFAGSTIPDGALECDGSVYSPSRYPSLFSEIGTTYGGTAEAPLLPPTEIAPWASATYIIWTGPASG
jgi:Phage Tail Collar Domain